jgi:pyrroloquinoline quinone biosynthesis protein B
MGRMRAIVLGAAAGGGFPQWNCGCPNCQAVRGGEPGWLPQTQDSLAVTSDGERFALINASPDVLTQIQQTRALWPRGPRHSPIGAVVLTNGDLDHVLGLFSLRESMPLAVYATESVWRGLDASVFLRTLQRFPGQLEKRTLVVGEEIELADAKGAPLGVRLRAFSLPGKPPVHLVGHAAPSPGDNVGLALRDASSQKTLAYAAACARATDVDLTPYDVVLFDGTFFREDELVRLGLSTSHAKDMAHVPIEGPDGSLAQLSALPMRKLYTHINNTNPILGETAERRLVEEAGWEIARDGMEIEL